MPLFATSGRCGRSCLTLRRIQSFGQWGRCWRLLLLPARWLMPAASEDSQTDKWYAKLLSDVPLRNDGEEILCRSAASGGRRSAAPQTAKHSNGQCNAVKANRIAENGTVLTAFGLLKKLDPTLLETAAMPKNRENTGEFLKVLEIQTVASTCHASFGQCTTQLEQ